MARSKTIKSIDPANPEVPAKVAKPRVVKPKVAKPKVEKPKEEERAPVKEEPKKERKPRVKRVTKEDVNDNNNDNKNNGNGFLIQETDEEKAKRHATMTEDEIARENLIEIIKRNILKLRDSEEYKEDPDMIHYDHTCVCGAGYDTVTELRNHFDNSDSCQEEFNYANELRLSMYVTLTNLKNEEHLIILIKGLVYVMKMLKANRKYLIDDKNDFHRLNLQVKNGIGILIDRLLSTNHPSVDEETRAYFEKTYTNYVMMYEQGSYIDEIYKRVKRDMHILEYVELEKMARDIKARKGSVKMEDLQHEIKSGIVDTRFFHILVEKGFIEKKDLQNVLESLQKAKETHDKKSILSSLVKSAQSQ